jgi:hypothetical protein
MSALETGLFSQQMKKWIYNQLIIYFILRHCLRVRSVVVIMHDNLPSRPIIVKYFSRSNYMLCSSAFSWFLKLVVLRIPIMRKVQVRVAKSWNRCKQGWLIANRVELLQTGLNYCKQGWTIANRVELLQAGLNCCSKRLGCKKRIKLLQTGLNYCTKWLGCKKRIKLLQTGLNCCAKGLDCKKRIKLL